MGVLSEADALRVVVESLSEYSEQVQESAASDIASIYCECLKAQFEIRLAAERRNGMSSSLQPQVKAEIERITKMAAQAIHAYYNHFKDLDLFVQLLVDASLAKGMKNTLDEIAAQVDVDVLSGRVVKDNLDQYTHFDVEHLHFSRETRNVIHNVHIRTPGPPRPWIKLVAILNPLESVQIDDSLVFAHKIIAEKTGKCQVRDS